MFCVLIGVVIKREYMYQNSYTYNLSISMPCDSYPRHAHVHTSNLARDQRTGRVWKFLVNFDAQICIKGQEGQKRRQPCLSLVNWPKE